MKPSPVKHLLTGSELNTNEILQLLSLARAIKQNIIQYRRALAHQQIGLIFSKPSLRTRFSFYAGVQALGGHVIESIANTRKQEEPEDLMRVLQGYCHAIMIRTHEDKLLQRMANVATVPIINGLTEQFHPCQILADLLTLQERFTQLSGLNLSYIGDGNNILHSLLLMAPALGINVHYACPSGHGPNARIVTKAKQATTPGRIIEFTSPKDAVAGCHAVYTDVWTSMGCDNKNEALFIPYQVNEALMKYARPDAVFMHCMPMQRGKEISASLPDQPCSIVFEQSANRLPAQQALLLQLITAENTL